MRSNKFLGATEATDDYNSYLVGLIKEFLPIYFPNRPLSYFADYDLIGPNGLRKQLGELSLEFFGRAYFPYYYTAPVGDFQRAAYDETSNLLNGPPSRTRWLRIWPRSYSKSTIYNFITPTSAGLYRTRPLTLTVSDTAPQAERFLADIRTEIEENEHIWADFGDVHGAIWRSDLISLKTERGTSYIAATGAESSVRGIRKANFRPKLIILDDLENDQSVLTQDRVEKRHRWLTRTLIPIGDPTTDIIYIGTVLAYDTVIDRISNDPSWNIRKYAAIQQYSSSLLWETWKNIRRDLSIPNNERKRKADELLRDNFEDMHKDVVTLWPEGRPYVFLMETLLEVGDLAFQAEYQNDPINPADCIFDREWFAFYDDETLKRRNIRITEIVGACDPSLGKSRMSDYTAIITLGRGDDGYIYVLDVVLERMPPDRIVDTILQKAKQYHYTRFGIEVNLFQELLKLDLQRESARRGLYIPIVEIRHNKDKVLRVQSLVPYIKNKYIKFRAEQRDLLDQLVGFPKVRFDDGPDCLEMSMKLMGVGPSTDAMELGIDPTNSYKSGLRPYEDDDEQGGFGLSWMEI